MTDKQGPDTRIEARTAVLIAVTMANERRARGDSARGLDIILGVVDNLIGSTDALFSMLGHEVPERDEKAFLGVSDALEEIDPTELEASHVLALLSSTSNLQSRIPSYADFYGRALAHFRETRPDELQGLLGGFEPDA